MRPWGSPPQLRRYKQGGTTVEGGAESASTYAAFLDWVNQGLLILAAALLLAGGIVIGYQLLRQPKDTESPDQPAASSDARQVTTPQRRRARPSLSRWRTEREAASRSWLAPQGAPPPMATPT